MKLKLYHLFVFMLLFVSCEDNFSPFGEFEDKYVLTCILRNDSFFQTLSLTKNYFPGNNDPESFTTDPSIIGADVRVWHGDSVYIFRDTTVARTDTTRYGNQYRFYYNKEFIINTSIPIEIEVLLEDGRRLRSSSVTASEIRFLPESEVLIPAVGSDLIQFFWESQETGTYFSSDFVINYKQVVNGTTVEKSMAVPVKYSEVNGEFRPQYPVADVRTNSVYTLDAVTKTLEMISAGDPDKQNYSIYQNPAINFRVFDLALSKYASSISESLNDLTVTVSAADFTNIEGGLGIFGSFINQNYPNIRFQPAYIESFGYNIIYSEN